MPDMTVFRALVKKKRRLEAKKKIWLAVMSISLVCLLGLGGFVYAKYFSSSAKWGVAIASGVYFSANYAAENEEFIESVVKKDYTGSNYDFTFEVRNYENNILFNESDVVIPYSVSFWLGEEPTGAEYYVVVDETNYSIGVGEENKCTLDNQSIEGGSARANEYNIKIVVPGSEAHEAVPVFVEVETAPGSVINKTLRGKMVLNNGVIAESYIESQGFIISDGYVVDFSQIEQSAILVYEIRTVGDVATDTVTDEIVLSWDPKYLAIDLFDEAYIAWQNRTNNTKPLVDDEGWYYITVEVMPYSAQRVYFVRGNTEIKDLDTLKNSIIAEKQ